MVKKVKLKITTTLAADVVLAALGKAKEAEEHLHTCGWPDDFRSLGAALAGASEQILQEGRSIAETFAAVCDEIEDVEPDGPDQIDDPEDLEQPWELDCNLMSASTEGLEQLKTLVEDVDESDWFLLEGIQLGRQGGGIDELVRVLDEHLDQREEEGEEPDDETVGSSGSWGDGDFSNAGTRSGTQVDAGPGVAFYYYHEVMVHNLPHPRSLDEAKRYFKQLTPVLHPDRNPSDRDANERFRRFVDGYEAVRRRLGGE